MVFAFSGAYLGFLQARFIKIREGTGNYLLIVLTRSIVLHSETEACFLINVNNLPGPVALIYLVECILYEL